VRRRVLASLGWLPGLPGRRSVDQQPDVMRPPMDAAPIRSNFCSYSPSPEVGRYPVRPSCGAIRLQNSWPSHGWLGVIDCDHFTTWPQGVGAKCCFWLCCVPCWAEEPLKWRTHRWGALEMGRCARCARSCTPWGR
jgi:hypothetical protein